MTKLQQERVANGLCKCGGTPINKFGKCQKCIDKGKAIHTRRREYQHQKFTAWTARNKILVIGHYSNDAFKCACCGEDNIDFLTIDHIDGGGNKHLTTIGSGKAGASELHRWLIKNSYPSGFQVLCFNCNISRVRNNGICPHKLPKMPIETMKFISNNPDYWKPTPG